LSIFFPGSVQPVPNCISYARDFGYSGYQSYLLLSTAPVDVAGIVDGLTECPKVNVLVPNACITLGIPEDIFDDVLPNAGGLKRLENLWELLRLSR
jgi:hypothetical protein